MLSNCDKMVVISSTTNEWPQNRVDEKDLMESTAGRVMEKPSQQNQAQQQQQQQQQAVLKCPRCDSSNTKFCYYNNYSLSQPRHFCKACKRYWTRGGTLRNVPVGGGCRKNKRLIKRPPSAIGGGGASPTSGGANYMPPILSQPQIDSINPLFYGLANNNNPSDMNLPFPHRFNSSGGYDLLLQQPQLNPLGLGFSTSNNPLLSSYNNSNIFGSSSSSTSTSTTTTTTTPTIASLLASTFQQNKFINGGSTVKNTTQPPPNYNFQTLQTFQDLHQMGENGLTMKDVKADQEAQSQMEWNNNVACQNQLEQIGQYSDPAVYWNANWHDPANIGSSLSSLI